MKKITKYACEYCPTTKKSYMSSTPVKKHEEICFYNPKNKTCLTCSKWCKEREYLIHDELPGSPTEYLGTTYECDYLYEKIENEETIKYGDCNIIKDCPHWTNKLEEQNIEKDY